MNWMLSKSQLHDIYVSTSKTQTANVLEKSNYVKTVTLETTLKPIVASTNEIKTVLDELISLPSSSKQNFEIEEISSKCASK